MERIQAAIEKARALRENRPLPDPAAAPVAAPEAPAAKAKKPAAKAKKSAARAKSAPKNSAAKPAQKAAAPVVAPRKGLKLKRTEEDAVPQDSAPAAEAIPRPHGAPRAPRFHLTDARSAWGDLKAFKPNPGHLRANRIVTYERADPAHIPYDMMRTRLLQFVRANGWSSVAVTSPTANCGKTTTCLNLAFSLAYQQDTRTVLMDVDLRRPAMAGMLGLKEAHSMSRILDGTGLIEDNFVRYGETLAIGTNDHPSRYPSELLQHQAAGEALERIQTQLSPDVMLYDMPPMMSNDDVMAFLPHVDCVLLVAAAEATTIDEIDRCERELGAQTNVLGVILNKCRYTVEKYGYY